MHLHREEHTCGRRSAALVLGAGPDVSEHHCAAEGRLTRVSLALVSNPRKGPGNRAAAGSRAAEAARPGEERGLSCAVTPTSLRSLRGVQILAQPDSPLIALGTHSSTSSAVINDL